MLRLTEASRGAALRLCVLASLGWGHARAADGTIAPFRYNGNAYVAYGIGTCMHGVTNTSVAGGGEGFLWRGLTLGGDVGYYRFVERNSKGFGIATLETGYHFVNRDAPGRFDPFVSAGLVGAAFAPGGGAIQTASAGGGMNYWFKRRVGLRTEVRISGNSDDALILFRIGFSFR